MQVHIKVHTLTIKDAETDPSISEDILKIAKRKEEVVGDFLRPLEKREEIEKCPVIPSPRDRAYRTRAQLKGGTVKGGNVLGFYERMSHRLIEVRECPLLHAPGNDCGIFYTCTSRTPQLPESD